MKTANRKKWNKSLTIVELASTLKQAAETFDAISKDLQLMIIKAHNTYDAVDVSSITTDNKIIFGIRLLGGRHIYTVGVGMDILTKQWFLTLNNEIESTTFTDTRVVDLGDHPEPAKILRELKKLPQLKSIKTASTQGSLSSVIETLRNL